MLTNKIFNASALILEWMGKHSSQPHANSMWFGNIMDVR